MELEIDDIQVTVDGDGDDDGSRDEVVQAVRQHILEAMEELSRSGPEIGLGTDEPLHLDLGEIDWESEPDMTGKIVQLLREAIEGAS